MGLWALVNDSRIRHAFSVDVEDWYQSTYDSDAELSDRFERSTLKVMDALDQHGVKATFFVLGLAAQKAPGVVREIARRGHIIQSHGFGHRSNFDLSKDAFREDILRAKMMLEDMAGYEVYGYRAPCFTIDQRNMWVLDILAETGHRYDSSIFPLKTRRYGVANYPLEPRIITTPNGHKMIEAPVTCFGLFGGRLPVGGGGYFRLWPSWAIEMIWRALEKRGRSGILYMHPYEYDPVEIDQYREDVALLDRLHQGIGRRSFSRKIDRLLDHFNFAPLEDVLSPLLENIA